MSALDDPAVCCGVLAQQRVWQVLREQFDRIEDWVRKDIHPKDDLPLVWAGLALSSGPSDGIGAGRTLKRDAPRKAGRL